MSASSMAMGILIPADMSMAPSVVPVTDHHDLQAYVGGVIDAVSNGFDPSDFGHDEEDPFTLVGYVHDEGLLIGLAENQRASVLFQRTLVGDVVLVSGTNPDTLEYDGDNYDVPAWFRDRVMDGSLEWVIANADAMSNTIATAMEMAVNDGVFSEQEMADVLRIMDTDDHTTLTSGEVEIVNLAIITSLVYYKGRKAGSIGKFDVRGNELLDQGVTDEMIAEFFRTEGGE